MNLASIEGRLAVGQKQRPSVCACPCIEQVLNGILHLSRSHQQSCEIEAQSDPFTPEAVHADGPLFRFQSSRDDRSWGKRAAQTQCVTCQDSPGARKRAGCPCRREYKSVREILRKASRLPPGVCSPCLRAPACSSSLYLSGVISNDPKNYPRCIQSTVFEIRLSCLRHPIINLETSIA